MSFTYVLAVIGLIIALIPPIAGFSYHSIGGGSVFILTVLCLMPLFLKIVMIDEEKHREAILGPIREQLRINLTDEDLLRSPHGLRGCLQCRQVGIFRMESKISGCLSLALILLLPLLGLIIYLAWDKATKNFRCPHCNAWTSVPINTPAGQEIYMALTEERRQEIRLSMVPFFTPAIAA